MEPTVTVSEKMTKQIEDEAWGYCSPSGELIEETLKSTEERAKVALQQMRVMHSMLGADASPRGEQEFFDSLTLVKVKLSYEFPVEDPAVATHGLNPGDVYVPADGGLTHK